jgi:predicted DNA-binding protein with PD1-like motif
MKLVLQNDPNFVLRFDKDEEVLDGLAKFMKEQNVSACVFNGIGACASVELGYYNEFIKEYRKKPFVEDMEIVSLNGNGGLKDGEPFIHAHGIFGRTDFTVFGGHVFKLAVSVTAEIFVTKLDGAIERANNPDFNLNLLV